MCAPVKEKETAESGDIVEKEILSSPAFASEALDCLKKVKFVKNVMPILRNYRRMPTTGFPQCVCVSVCE